MTKEEQHPALDLLQEDDGAHLQDMRPDQIIDITDFFDQTLSKAENDLSADMPEKDRFFELMIQRFEAMQSYKAAVLAIGNLCKKSPDHARVMLESNKNTLSQIFMISKNNGRKEPGLIEIGLLFYIYHATFHTFETDNSDSLQCTMKKLNTVLIRTEKILFG